MLAIISPAKTLDLDPPPPSVVHSEPDFLHDAQELIDTLVQKSADEISNLMSISEKLSILNRNRYHQWKSPFTTENAKQAILAFQGDVYQPIETGSYKKADFNFIQKHVRILSGLYGVLRPLDLMQAYRLEMGTKLKTGRGKDLYEFWGDQLTESLNTAIGEQRGRQLVNLASNEYSKAARLNNIDAEIITPHFKDLNKGKYKIVSFYAKRARGMMVNYMVRNRVKDVEGLKEFNVAGYAFNGDLSTNTELTFTRDEPA